ncbi:holin, partial [Bacillus thuringiensis]|nr:holin [Bacillus thuringiensis]
ILGGKQKQEEKKTNYEKSRGIL